MKRFAMAFAMSAMMPRAIAGPIDYVSLPTVEHGEREIDFKYGVANDGDAEEESGSSLGFGLGVRPWWFVELNAIWENGAGAGAGWELEEFEIENKFQLTEAGRHAVDLGLLFELEFPREGGETKEWKIGPLFQKELGRTQFNWNVIFEREFGGERASGEEHEIELAYQWQVKYRWRPVIEFGAQGLGEVGEWSDWEASEAQSHVLGPAAFGRLRLGDEGKLTYNTALLFGVSDGAPDRTFRLQVEYEF